MTDWLQCHLKCWSTNTLSTSLNTVYLCFYCLHNNVPVTLLTDVYSCNNEMRHFFNLDLILYSSGARIAQWATGYRLDDRGGGGLESRQGMGIFPFTTTTRLVLGHTQPPIQWIPGAISLGVKRPGREAVHSPPSSSEVKNAWSYTSTPPIRLPGVVLS
jgi:hypothetical protein